MSARSLGDILAGPAPKVVSRRRHWRHGAVFVLNPREHYRPIDRNDRAKLIALAERLERASKGKGSRCGVLGHTGLSVLRALVFRFLGADGRLEPSYGALQAATGLCRQTVAKAIRALEALGLVQIIRRLVRRRITRTSPLTGELETIVLTTQGANLYRLALPATLQRIPLPIIGGIVRRFPPRRPEPSLLGRLEKPHGFATSMMLRGLSQYPSAQ